MKRILTSLLTVMIGIVCIAQSESVATLMHNGEISTYYGFDALGNAYIAATDGDVITLSKGTFRSTHYLQKSIAIRGAGCFNISQDNIESTIIMGEINFTGENLNIEGVLFNDDVYMNLPSEHRTLINSKFSNCFFKSRCLNYNGDPSFSNIFTHCYLSDLANLSGENTFISCVACFSNSSNGSGVGGDYCVYNFNNCIIYPFGNGSYEHSCYYSTFRNCIILKNNDIVFNAIEPSYGAIAYNCISVGNEDIFSEQIITTNKTVDLPLSSIFKTYEGSGISLEQRFELTDSAATVFLGGDGTQVGIYGGVFPFNPAPSYPVISKFDVSNKTDADGKIRVSIEVKSAQ